MNEEVMNAADAALLRSRLHISSARTLIDHDKIAHALGTLYDALEYALKWCYLSKINHTLDIHHTEDLFKNIKARGLIKSDFDFLAFHILMESSLDDSSVNPDIELLWKESQEFLTDLGVVPYTLEIEPEDDLKTREILDI